MGGSRAKNIKLLEFENDTSKKTKEEIELRRSLSVDLGTATIKLPKTLRGHKKASKRFKEIVKLYEDAGLMLVSTADLDFIVEYALNYQSIWETREALESFSTPQQKLFAVDDYCKLMRILDSLQTKMIRLSDYLYLNPVARARTGGKLPTEKKVSPLEQKGFGNL